MVIDNWKQKLNKQTEERVSETEHTKEKKSLKEKNGRKTYRGLFKVVKNNWK